METGPVILMRETEQEKEGGGQKTKDKTHETGGLPCISKVTFEGELKEFCFKTRHEGPKASLLLRDHMIGWPAAWL